MMSGELWNNAGEALSAADAFLVCLKINKHIKSLQFGVVMQGKA